MPVNPRLLAADPERTDPAHPLSVDQVEALAGTVRAALACAQTYGAARVGRNAEALARAEAAHVASAERVFVALGRLQALS